ncbi:hypothetical protein EDB85DRAFT_1895305 [Lactarius pseudohatsudake]|nr:hypothetical protein EDB85DRAFT_1895305 [Lactarius pseudohatsudake]
MSGDAITATVVTWRPSCECKQAAALGSNRFRKPESEPTGPDRPDPSHQFYSFSTHSDSYLDRAGPGRDEALTTATLCDYDDDDDCNNQGNRDHDGNDLTTAAGNVPIYGGDSAASLRENLCIRTTGARGMHHFLQSGGLEVPEQAFLSNHDHTHEATTTATAIEATTTTSDEVPHGAMVTVWAYYS